MPARDPRQARLSKQVLTSLEVLGWKRSDQGPASTLASVIDALRESHASSQRGASDAVKSTQLPHDHAHDQHDGQANVNYPQLHQHVVSVPSEDGADLANALLERVLPRGYLSGVPMEGLEPNQSDVEQLLKQWKLCYRAATSGPTVEADAQGRLADLCCTLWHAVRKMTFLTRSRTEAEAAYPGMDVTALLVFLRPWEKMVPMTDSALQASSWVMVVLYELMTHIWNLRVKVQQHVGALAVQPSPDRDMAPERQHAAEGNAAEAECCSEGLGRRWQDLQRWCQKLLTSMICWLLCQAEALPGRGPDGLALLLQLGGAVLIMLLQSVVDGVLDFQDEGTTDVSKLVSRLTSSLMEVTIRTRGGESSARLAAGKAPGRNAAADGEGGASYPTVVSPGAVEAARAAEAPQKLIRNLNADVLQKLRVSSSSAASASGRRRPANAGGSPRAATAAAPASPAAAATTAPVAAAAAASLAPAVPRPPTLEGGEWQLVEAAGPSRAAALPQGWGSTVPAGWGPGPRRRPKGVGAIIRRYLRSRRFTAGEFPHWRRRDAVPAVVMAPARSGLPPGFMPAGTYSPAAGVMHLAPSASMPNQMRAAPPGYWLQGRGSLPVHFAQHTAQLPPGVAPGAAHAAYTMQAADAQLADRPPGDGPGPAKGLRKRMAAWSKSAQVMWERVSSAGARLTEEMQAQFTSASGQPQPDIAAAIPPIHEHPRLAARPERPPAPSLVLAGSLPQHIAAPAAVPAPAAAEAAPAAPPSAPPSAPPLPAYLADAAGMTEAQAAAAGAPSLYPVAVPAMGVPVASDAWHRAQSAPAEAGRARASSSGLYPTVGAASAAEPFGAHAPSEAASEMGLWPAVGRPSASSRPEPLPAGAAAAAPPSTAAYPVVGGGLYPSLASPHSAAPREQHHHQQPPLPAPTAVPPAAGAPLYPVRVDAVPPSPPGMPAGNPDLELLPSAPLLGSTQSCPVPSPQPSGEASPDPFVVMRPSNSCDSTPPQPSPPPRLDSDSGADDSEASMMASAEEMRAAGVSELEERLVHMMGRELTSEIYHLETSMDQDALLLEYLLGRCEVISHREVRLVGELGCGSFATVFRGEWSVPGVGRLEVAVKLLHEDIHNMDATVDSQEFKEFMREVECLRVLNHECVVKLLGVVLPEDEAWGGSSLASEPSTDPEEASWSSGQLEYGPSSGMPLDRLCIVMEYCLLGSLMDLIHQAKEVKGAFDRLMKDSGAPVCTKTLHNRMLADLERYIQQPGARLYFEWPLRLKLLGQAALGLAHMHDHHFLHRDLTSYNILVHSEVPEEEPVTLPQWTAKVADFNLCCYSSDGRQTYNSLGPHSPGWTAPELNQQGQITTASDVFSLGVVLWELLTLNRPPGGGTECYKVIFAAMHNNTQVLDFPIESELSPKPPLGWSHDVIVSLAQQCMHQEMAMRPTARQVSTTIDSLVQRLQS